MAQEAVVKFSETGSSQVEGAFKNIGTAASGASTNIDKASTAQQGLGKTMKNSASSIGNVATAFATLSLSIVGTYRAYRDLGDAQIAVDKANKRVKDTSIAITKLEKEIAADKKASSKGSLDYALNQAKLNKMQQDYNKHQKDGKHTSADLKLEYLQLQKARKDGIGTSKELGDKEIKLGQLEEKLGIQTDVAKEAQERFNDTQQNFYLSLLPTAISSIATLTTGFSNLKGVLTGGGGLVGGLGPIGLILTGISAAVLAFKTNFLGLRDAVGGVINWIKERFGLWKQGIEDVFSFIKAGDWAGAFERIGIAAAKFWEDLKKTVPLFGGVSNLAEQLSKGDWVGAFKTIRDAAVFFWTELKKAIPLFGTIEKIITQISQGKWGDAFNTIRDAAVTFWLDLIKKVPFLGDLATYLRTKLELAQATAKNVFSQMAKDLKDGPLKDIQDGLAAIGKGDFAGGFSAIWVGLDKAIGMAITRINDWIKLNFGIDLVALNAQANAVGKTILDGILKGLTFVAHTWIDPILTKLFDPALWESAIQAQVTSTAAGGQKILGAILGAIQGAASDPKGTGDFWSNIGQSIWDGIVGWMSANVPDTLKAMDSLVQGFTNSFNQASTAWKNLGIDIWNNIVDGMKYGIEQTRKNPLGDLLLFNNKVKDMFNSPDWKNLGHVAKIQPTVDMKPFMASTRKSLADAAKLPPPKMKIDGNTSLAEQKRKAMQNAINNTHATIKISAVNTGPFGGLGLANWGISGHAQGTDEVVDRPTLFMAGEGGRPEHVYVNPIGHSGRNAPGGGGTTGPVHVHIHLKGKEIAEAVIDDINAYQSIFK